MTQSPIEKLITDVLHAASSDINYETGIPGPYFKEEAISSAKTLALALREAVECLKGDCCCVDNYTDEFNCDACNALKRINKLVKR